jgi:hypothetical protein
MEASELEPEAGILCHLPYYYVYVYPVQSHSPSLPRYHLLW